MTCIGLGAPVSYRLKRELDLEKPAARIGA